MKAAITSAQQAGGLRQLKKLETMRHVQLTALGLFEAHGFDAVTIEEVASAARVSASTVYRPFDTKEGLVIWDEYDPVLLRALAERLRVDALGDAIERRSFDLPIASTMRRRLASSGAPAWWRITRACVRPAHRASACNDLLSHQLNNKVIAVSPPSPFYLALSSPYGPDRRSLLVLTASY
jgi:AcrR family transcriptional regulator